MIVTTMLRWRLAFPSSLCYARPPWNGIVSANSFIQSKAMWDIQIKLLSMYGLGFCCYSLCSWNIATVSTSFSCTAIIGSLPQWSPLRPFLCHLLQKKSTSLATMGSSLAAVKLWIWQANHTGFYFLNSGSSPWPLAYPLPWLSC